MGSASRGRDRAFGEASFALAMAAALLLVMMLGPAGLAANATVSVGNTFFSPAEVVINAGESVTWQRSAGGHTAKAEDGDVVWCASLSSATPTCARTFTTPGFYRYFCSIHPTQMRASVIVVDPNAPTAAIAMRSAESTDNGDGGGPSIALDRPPGTVQYDVMLAQITVRGGSATAITPPAGWTLVLRTDETDALGQAIYSKVAGASEGASYAWTLEPDDRASGGILTYSGPDNSDPVDASGGQSDPSSTSITAPGVATTTANTRLVGLFGIRAGTTIAPPAGMTERYDEPNSERVTSQACDEARAAAGGTGARTATAGSSDENVGQLVALRVPTVSFAQAASSGDESVTSVGLPVALSGASSASVTVAYAVTGGTATSGADFTLVAGTLTFAAGSTSQDIPLSVIDDADVEAAETIVVTLSSPGLANLGAVTEHEYTLLDNDAAPPPPPPPPAGNALVNGVVDADGAPVPGGSWGGWSAAPGAPDVWSTNYLQITNMGLESDRSIVIDFTDSAWTGTNDTSFAIPIDGNVRFAWFEDTTPDTTSPTEGSYSVGEVAASGSVTLSFTTTTSVLYVHYRVANVPAPLPIQNYAATFTVTEV